MTLPIVTGLLLCAYAGIILHYRRAWGRTAVFTPPVGKEPVTTLSVIVPARNEEAVLGACLDSLRAQDYPAPLWECIVVDDQSTDGTGAVADARADGRIRVLRLPSEPGRGGKKDALAYGIAAATGRLIVTTDADCTHPTGWLRTLAACYEARGAVAVAAPVMYARERTALDVFQSLDFLSLQGITAAAVTDGFHGMGNGANLAYEREAFGAVGGFSGIDGIASGDDMLLLQKYAEAYPGKTAYCLSREATVTTRCPDSLGGFLQQRIRWASKAAHYREARMTAVLALVYLLNLGLLALAGRSIFDGALWPACLGLVLAKTAVEAVFLMPVARFFGKQRLMRWFPAAQPFHILYTVAAGLFGQVGGYRWKGRIGK